MKLEILHYYQSDLGVMMMKIKWVIFDLGGIVVSEQKDLIKKTLLHT